MGVSPANVLASRRLSYTSTPGNSRYMDRGAAHNTDTVRGITTACTGAAVTFTCMALRAVQLVCDFDEQVIYFSIHCTLASFGFVIQSTGATPVYSVAGWRSPRGRRLYACYARALARFAALG